MVRLVSHIVVDPDPILVKEAPDLGLVGRRDYYLTLLGDDALRLEIAATLTHSLAGHNQRRLCVAYEKEEGEIRNLKPIKISDLYIHVAEHKRW